MIVTIKNIILGGFMDTYKKLFSYIPEKMHCIYLSLFFSLVASIFQVLPFYYFYKLLNEIIVKGDFERSKNYAITIFVYTVLYALTYFAAGMFSHFAAFRLESNIREKGAKHLMEASFAFFDKNESGKIRKIIDDNASETHMIVAHLIPDMSQAFLVPIWLIVLLFLTDIKLGIFTLMILVFSIMMLIKMMGNKEFMRLYNESLERMNAEAVEYVRGMQVIKIFNSSIESFKSFYEAIVNYSKNAFNYTLSCRTPFVSFQVVLNIIMVITIPFFYYFINKSYSGSELLVSILFFATIGGLIFTTFMKIMYVSMYKFNADMTMSKLDEIFKDMEENKLVYGKNDGFDNFNIEFEGVDFKYEDKYILKDFSMKLDEKKTYALVGSSGSGKSTIAKIISGFYPVNNGKLKIGDKDISSYSEKALMDNIAFVFQNSKLFKTSIYENVKMGRKDASHKEVMDALKSARCMDILDKFETRENTIIGSKGVHLSGGEVQRIAIARAILKNANIIILDEASAASDPENEYEIQQAFSSLMKDKTVIMIAHRLSSIRNADEILVIEAGKILERGKDLELIEKKSRYFELQTIYGKANDWRLSNE